jgi:hypothetical protein
VADGIDARRGLRRSVQNRRAGGAAAGGPWRSPATRRAAVALAVAWEQARCGRADSGDVGARGDDTPCAARAGEGAAGLGSGLRGGGAGGARRPARPGRCTRRQQGRRRARQQGYVGGAGGGVGEQRASGGLGPAMQGHAGLGTRPFCTCGREAQARGRHRGGLGARFYRARAAGLACCTCPANSFPRPPVWKVKLVAVDVVGMGMCAGRMPYFLIWAQPPTCLRILPGSDARAAELPHS